MARTERCNYDFKRHNKSIIIVTVLGLIYPATVVSAQGSANEWQQWKDEEGKPFCMNHDIKKAQRECPEQLKEGQPDQVTEIPYPQTMEEKMKIFNVQLDKSAYITGDDKQFAIRVGRSRILNDSYGAVMGRGAKKNLRKMLKLDFKDQNEINSPWGECYAKEWFSLLSKEISDPQNGFLQYVELDHNQMEIIANNNKPLKHFRFFGRVVGAAVYRQIPLNLYFVTPYYKIMLSRPIEPADVQSSEPYFYANLSETDYDELKNYDSSTRNTKNTITKAELISKIVQIKYQTSVEKQMSAFLEGFADLIPLHLLRIFTTDELIEFIGGAQLIDVYDWMRNADYVYSNDRNAEDNHRNAKVVEWFWKIVRGFSKEEKHRLLQFVIGTSTVPASGFQALSPKFKIVIDCCEKVDLIPTASICFNSITLTDYTSEESLEELLQKAIKDVYHFS